jgi:hypothetical protein
VVEVENPALRLAREADVGHPGYPRAWRFRPRAPT